MADFSTYANATAQLQKVLGQKAPDLILLIEHTLRCRDAQGLTEDYLESIDWPIVSPAKKVAKSRRSRSSDSHSAMSEREVLPAPPSGDPARN